MSLQFQLALVNRSRLYRFIVRKCWYMNAFQHFSLSCKDIYHHRVFYFRLCFFLDIYSSRHVSVVSPGYPFEWAIKICSNATIIGGSLEILQHLT